MTALTDFLLARIAEDEALARAAAVGSLAWHLDDLDETVLWWQPSSPERVTFIRERLGDDAADRDAQWRGQTVEVAGDQIAPHIARHDPARVLAECEAKRRIVDLHRAEGGDDEFRLCRRCHGSGPEAQGYPCDTLQALALPYADHPDFDPAWRP